MAKGTRSNDFLSQVRVMDSSIGSKMALTWVASLDSEVIEVDEGFSYSAVAALARASVDVRAVD